ncbi:MAG: DMT family transporter [Candidatus Thorarchaeota archaeon]
MLGELAAIGAPACFAISAIIYRNPLKETDAASASIVRFAGTGFILFATLFLVWGTAPLFGLSIYVVLLTVLSGITALGLGDVLYMTSFKEVGVSRTVSVVATYPMFSLAIEFLTGRGEVLIIAIVGALQIFIGIWLLSRSGETNQDSIPSANIHKGLIAALSVAFLYSISMLLIDEALNSLATTGIESAFAVNALRTASGGVFLLIASPIIDRKFNFLEMGRKFIGLFLIGSLIAYGVGWYLLTWAFLLAPTSSVVPLSSTTPLFATILAVVILREPLKGRGALGILLIVVGIMLIVVG